MLLRITEHLPMWPASLIANDRARDHPISQGSDKGSSAHFDSYGDSRWQDLWQTPSVWICLNQPWRKYPATSDQLKLNVFAQSYFCWYGFICDYGFVGRSFVLTCEMHTGTLFWSPRPDLHFIKPSLVFQRYRNPAGWDIDVQLAGAQICVVSEPQPLAKHFFNEGGYLSLSSRDVDCGKPNAKKKTCRSCPSTLSSRRIDHRTRQKIDETSPKS